jgi:OOP family OmpA-OmpF porin
MKMSIKNMSLAVLSAATMVSASSVFAQAAPESGLYLGAGFGQTKAKDLCQDFPPGVSCDDKDTSYNLFVGYDFNRIFAAEVGYVNFGEVKASGVGGSASWEATAFEAVGVAKWPVWQNLSVYGKLGAYRWDVDARVNAGAVSA